MTPSDHQHPRGPAAASSAARLRPPAEHPTSAASRAFDRAATSLMAAILARRPWRAPFPVRLGAALAASLDFLQRHPTLARSLTAELGPDPALLARQRSWTRTFAGLLRAAAEEDPQLRLPPIFVESHLIAGLAWTIGRSLAHPEHPDLLPSLLEYVLAYYCDPVEHPALLATATRSAEAAARARLQ